MKQFHVASEAMADRVCAFLRAQAAAKPVVVTVAEPKRLRSLAANSRYWLLMTLIADHVKPNGEAFSKDAWHEWFKRRFLKSTEVRLPSGRVIQDYPSTAEMAHEEFNAYMMQVEVWANERGVILE